MFTKVIRANECIVLAAVLEAKVLFGVVNCTLD